MRRTTLIGGLLLAMSATAMASQVYTWVDEKGVTHFSEQPPNGRPAASFSTSSPVSRMPPPAKLPAQEEKAPEQEAIDKKVKREIAVKEAERKKYCETVRTRLAYLENNPRLRAEIDGEMRRLTEEERQARIAEAQKAIKESCE